jgi:hypothetical protein
MVLRLAFQWSLFVCLSVSASDKRCITDLLEPGAAAWETTLKTVRENIINGFQLEGIPSGAPLMETSYTGTDKYLNVARRLSWAKRVEGEQRFRVFDGNSDEHLAVFQGVSHFLQNSPSKYNEACKQARNLRNLSTCVSFSSGAGAVVAAFWGDWATTASLAPVVFLSEYFGKGLASVQERENENSLEGRQLKRLSVHASLVQSPVAGAWAATGFNREVYTYESLEGIHPVTLQKVRTHFLDVFTWVDDALIPHTAVLFYSSKGP